MDVGTISALENRDSDRSKFFPQIAKAFGLTLEQLADTSTDYYTNPPRLPGQPLIVMEAHRTYEVDRTPDAWLAEGNRILASLNPDDRRAAVLSLRVFVQNLGHPATAKLYQWPVRKREPQGKKYSHPAQQQLDFVGKEPWLQSCNQGSLDLS